MTDDEVKGEFRMALLYAELAMAAARRGIEARLTPEQRAEIERELADGTGRLALFVSRSEKQAHFELALIGPAVETVFSRALARLDSPRAAAVAPKDAVRVVNRSGMN